MANEQFKALMDFYREFIKPDLDEVQSTVKGLLTKDEQLSHMDNVYKRLDRVDSELQSLSGALRRLEAESQVVSAAVKRLEERLAATDAKLDRMAFRSELVELKDQVAHINERIAQLEKALN